MACVERTFASPLGPITVAATPKGVRSVSLRRTASKPPKDASVSENASLDGLLRKAQEQILEYLEGKRRAFELPLDMDGTPFRKQVWEATRRIPYGETRSYGQVARQLGNPNASRAVGGALGANPLMMLVPCHRVVGGNGDLTGFGSGLDVKAWLLRLEQSEGTLTGNL